MPNVLIPGAAGRDGERQVRDLEATIAAVDCDLVLVGTPIDLARRVRIEKPWQRVTYELAEEGPELRERVRGVADAVRRASGSAGDQLSRGG